MGQERRELDVLRDLADLMILDRDKRPVGRVDDVEFDDGNPPAIVAILVGTPALAGRFSSRLNGWMRGAYRRLDAQGRAEPVRIGIEHVRTIDSRVDVDVAREDLGIGELDRWIIETTIGKIPGADHAPE
jgi:sporulation protein YlmC with PRC-barrel domain